MILDRAVTLIAIAEITAEATHREVAAAVHRFQFVHVSKLARRHERHSEPIDSGKCVAQLWMSKTDRRTLDRFGEIPRGRPIPRNVAGL
jgi:hypothetical protein